MCKTLAELTSPLLPRALKAAATETPKNKTRLEFGANCCVLCTRMERN